MGTPRMPELLARSMRSQAVKVLALAVVLLAIQSQFVLAGLGTGQNLDYLIGYYAMPTVLMFVGGVWRIRARRWTRISGFLVCFGFYGQFIGPQLRACIAT